MTAIILIVEGVRTRASTNEALITFAIPLEQAELVSGFMSKIGKQVGAAFADVEPSTEKNVTSDSATSPHAFGHHAKSLKLSGFFRTPDIWKVVGTDTEFLIWVRRQPSAHSGDYSEWVNGEGRCEAAHISRIEYGRGIGHKPDYSAIPLTHVEHALTHTAGESALRPREWFEQQRIKYVENWAWDKLKIHLGYDSMADVPPAELLDWATRHDVAHHLPAGYKNVNRD